MIDDALRLLGNVAGRRVLQLGWSGEAAITVSTQGAHVISVVDRIDDFERAQAAVAKADAHVELHHGDVAELAFIRADTVDAAFSAASLRGVDDLDRVFRQVHRVLRTDAPLVVVVPHPTFEVPAEAYFDRSDNRRTISDLFGSLDRAHFTVDTLLEPNTKTLVLRGRKLGN